jgi:hypothetical protein
MPLFPNLFVFVRKKTKNLDCLKEDLPSNNGNQGFGVVILFYGILDSFISGYRFLVRFSEVG